MQDSQLLQADFSDEIDLGFYLSLLRQWLWLIILCAVLAGAAAFIASKVMTPVYQARTTVMISEPPGKSQSDYTALLTSERLAKTYSEMLTTRPVLDQVIATLGLDVTAEELSKSIKVKQVPNTQLIEVTVDDFSPVRAADIANTLVQVFIERTRSLESARYAESKQTLKSQIDAVQTEIVQLQQEIKSLPPEEEAKRSQLETALAQYTQTYNNLLQTFESLTLAEAQSASNVYQVEPAQPPEKPIRPRTLLNTVLAAIVGAMLAVGTVFLLRALDKTIQTPDEVQHLLNLPVIGLVPDISATIQKNGAAPLVTPRSPAAEAFRSLRANLEFLSPDHPIQVLLVTSTEPGEGKSFTATNLAQILAQAGRKVTLVDCDLRRPTVHKILGVPNRQGLSSIFRGMPLQKVMRELRSNFHVITSGPLPPNPSELLSSARMEKLLDELKQINGVIILDGPPGFISDTHFLAAKSDGVLLVMQPGHTDRALSRQLTEQLHRLGARVLGAVFNRVSPRGGYGYYYSYQEKYNRYYHEEATK